MGWSSSTNSLYDDITRTSSDSGYYVNDLPGVTVDLLNYVDDEKNVSDYVAQVHDSEIIKLVDAFIMKAKDNLHTKELLAHNTMIQDFNELDRTISKDGRFVGYVITPRESNTISCKIREAGFLTSAADSFTLYLFDTSHKEAIQSKTVTTTDAETIKWTSLDWDVSFDREAGSAGQRYLIGYFEDDITSDLYDMTWNGQSSHFAQRVFGHYMGISPVRFNSGTLQSTSIPKQEYLRSSLNCRTSGFNLRFNTKCDITKVLVDNISMFAEALQLKIAVRILQDALSYATLNNVTNAQMLREKWTELIDEYNGKLNGGVTAAGIPVKGLIDHLSIDFSSIDAVCLKNVQGKVRYAKW